MKLKPINREFLKNGYCIIDLFSKNQIELVKKTIIKKLKRLDNKSKYLNKLNKYRGIDG